MKLKRFTDSVTGISRSALSISFRLLLFNVLLVFLPIAAVLYLDIYEGQLLDSQEKSMVQQGRLLSAALSEQGELNIDKVSLILENLANRTETRLRVVDSDGWLVGDTSSAVIAESEPIEKNNGARYKSVEEVLDEDSLLYRLAIYPIVVYRKIFNPPVPVDEPRFYTSTTQFKGKEIIAALNGYYGAATRLSSGGQRSVTLYTAIPISNGGETIGAVLSSQSTYRILRDLYEIRLFILRIFLASLAAAILISFFLSRTISHRIKVLSKEAQAIKTGKGRIKGSFTPLKLNDEIGDLSRSLKDLTDRLDRHIQFIDSLSRDISHEFKNPLAVIKSASEMIGRSEGAQQERFIELIDRNTGRMESLLNGVEEISRLDSHMDKEKKESVNIISLIDTLLDGFKLQYPRQDWPFERSDWELCVWGAPERLSQIFVNLFENASSFSRSSGSIITTVKGDKAFLGISIYNDGPLIPEEDLGNIFNRFFSSREVEKEKHHGLGLSIVKTIVETYGGSVSVKNNERGVSFTVFLPLII
ncbi:MAG: HAMP domain-containing sensor histidine kinase [Spirochaetaceae bacterium]|jgi:two-component system sensor histidine kinase ChvG|nr:HAMP domain-containing sensor histidine kinase [Spirochaetaceae bacterium]